MISTRTNYNLQHAIGLILGSLVCTGLAHAQSETERGLEEIIVTSQKRPQTLHEVPISVSAVDGVKIDKLGVENLEDLTMLAPGIHFTETGLSTQMRIRGIGSDNSQGFEQSVGVFVDGVYRSRAQLFRAPMFDVERVEVLRGPQSTLFGKNSIAGAIDIITAKPTDELQAEVSGNYETEFGTRELSGFLSGPLNDEFKGRVAFRHYDDPGYMVNTHKERDEAQQKEKALRVSLGWTPNPNLNIQLTAEHDTFDVHGRFLEVVLDEAPTEPQSGSPIPLTYGQILRNFSPTLTYDPQLNYERQSNAAEYSYNQIDTQTLRVDYDTPHFTVTSVTGAVAFDYDENCDCDFTAANIFHLDLQEEYEQLSQEIRLVSADDDTFTWLGGVFYQEFDQTFHDTFNIPEGSLLVPAFQTVNSAFPNSFAGTGIDRHFEQSSKAYALFAEGTWHIRDDVRITVGARYTDETKEAEKVLNMVDLSQNNRVIDEPTLAGIYLNLFNTETEQSTGHNLNGSRDEEVFTPAINVSWDITDNVMTYAKATKGFKAGGFDPRSNVKSREATDILPGETEPREVSAFEFEEEEVIAYELGSKMRLADGKMELNTAVYRMDYDDLQISQFDGAVGFNVGNANKTVVQGLEIDGRWQLSSNLLSSFGLSYLDFEYQDFKNGNCYYGQGVPGESFCDYTGQRGVYTPKLMFNGSLAYQRSINSHLGFESSLDVQWIDEQQTHVNLDPKGEIDPYTMLALRLALASENWELAILGKNLLNEEVMTYTANMPMAENVFQTRTFYGFVQRPRTYTLELTYRL